MEGSGMMMDAEGSSPSDEIDSIPNLFESMELNLNNATTVLINNITNITEEWVNFAFY